MKIMVIFSFLFFSLGCSAISNEFLIGKQQVSFVLLGDEKSRLLKSYGEYADVTEVNREGDWYPAIEFCVARSCFIAELDESDRVWAIRISSERYETAKGIGVGSTFQEVLDGYPSSDFLFGPEDGGFISLFVKDINAIFSFKVDDKNFPKIVSGKLKSEDMYSQKVEEILVHNLPAN